MPHDPAECSFDELETDMLLTEREVAEQLHIKRCTVRNERLRGEISYVRIHSRYYYTQEHVDAYIKEHTTRTTSQRGDQPAARPTVIAPSARFSDGPDEATRKAVSAAAKALFTRRPRGLRKSS